MGQATIKKDMAVAVISGANRGKSGKVLQVDREKGRVWVEGVNMGKKAMRKTAANAQSGFVEKERPIHISNVMSAERAEARKNKRAAK